MFSFIANTLASTGIIIDTIVKVGSPITETYTVNPLFNNSVCTPKNWR